MTMSTSLKEKVEELSLVTEELCPGCDREVTLVLGDEGLELHVECDCGSGLALA